MKTRTILALVLVLSFVLGSVAMAAAVEPYVERFPPTSDAAYICVTGLDYDFGYMVEFWNTDAEFWPFDPGEVVEFTHASQTITIGNNGTSQDEEMYSGGYYFDWMVDPDPLGVVVVKGGNSANFFVYDGAYSDIEMCAPSNEKTGKNYAITHVVFCWDRIGSGGEEECYQEETAWADGDRYVDSNWATYVTYEDGLVADIYAGQDMLAGTATFTEVNGEVEIFIQLINDWIFYYDLEDEQADDNVKVQDYDEPPDKNPAPGQFDYKEYAEVGNTEYTITVPLNSYYGVHLDVAQLVACE